jgi:hypothetical protein
MPVTIWRKGTFGSSGASNINRKITTGSRSVYAPQIIATGGTIYTVNGYTMHVFTSSGIWAVTKGGLCSILVIGGGAVGSGNGGNYTTGGGGAGGLVFQTDLIVIPGTYTATVGAGGTGYLISGSPRTGNPGFASSFLAYIANGGIGGQYGNGGNQGDATGVNGNTGYFANSGGGGGAGAAATSRNGGAGKLISQLAGIAGFNNTGYFGGGGAGFSVAGFGTSDSGGGDGITGAGAANTGGGGAAKSYNTDIFGFPGGSGIVMVMYQ